MDQVTYKFHFEEKWQEVTGTPEQVLVEMTISHDIRTPHACLEGGCGSCKARLLDGKVDMPSTDILSDEEVAAGYILTCMAKPLTPTISLDFDID